MILIFMKNDEYRLTKENVDDYLHNEKLFFLGFDYNSIFSK